MQSLVWRNCKKVLLYLIKKKKKVIPSTEPVIPKEPCGLAEALCVTEPGTSTRPGSGFRLPGRSSELKRYLEESNHSSPQLVMFLVVKRKKGSPAVINTFFYFLPFKTWSYPVGVVIGVNEQN